MKNEIAFKVKDLGQRSSKSTRF